MIDFYTDGSTVGVAFSGWTTIFLIVYIAFEIINWSTTRIFFIEKVILYFRVRRYIKSVIPYWWSIENISIIGMQKMKRDNITEVPVKVRYKKPGVNETYTASDYLIIKNKNLSCGTLMTIIDGFDKANGIDRVQMKRDKTLSDLGV